MECDAMKLDMTFWGKSEQYKYGIVITIDYANQRYGWRSKAIDSDGISFAESFFGYACSDVINPPHIISPLKDSATNTMRVISIDDFTNKLLPHMDNLIVYTGAGMAIDAGIWDLTTLREKLYLNDLKDFLRVTNYDKEKVLFTVKEFARQLYETKPTDSYEILGELQIKFNITIATENRDMLHQKAGHKVITRDILKRFPLWLFTQAAYNHWT
jgi:NAD-dependent protein deacetylases, SIR2 family